MKKDFVDHAKNKERLGMSLSVLTFGLCFRLFYSMFFLRKYYLNRRLLLRLLKNNEITLQYGGDLSINNIATYSFSHNGRNYTIWHYMDERKFTLHDKPFVSAFIGLFIGDLQQKRVVRKTIKYFIKPQSAKTE